jgi:hypothetical protein
MTGVSSAQHLKERIKTQSQRPDIVVAYHNYIRNFPHPKRPGDLAQETGEQSSTEEISNSENNSR